MSQVSEVDLYALFNEINQIHFDGLLDDCLLRWNTRLRSSAGRFVPCPRLLLFTTKPTIEIAPYLKEELNALEHIRDTLGHEMIHYWLWMRKRPYGHTPEFRAKMKQMGVSRYNPVPRVRSLKYLYYCSHCFKTYPSRKKLRLRACGQCCNQHAGGKFDERFKLAYSRKLIPGETLEPFLQG